VAVLRQFLHLDEALVDQFLAQLEGGVAGDEAQRLHEHRGKERGGEAGVAAFGARAGLKAGGTSGSEEEIERTIQQTSESKFARLYDMLEAQGAIDWLERVDAQIWDQLRRGAIVELEASISVSTLARLTNLAAQAGPWLN
jgi:hypothetical protein